MPLIAMNREMGSLGKDVDIAGRIKGVMDVRNDLRTQQQRSYRS